MFLNTDINKLECGWEGAGALTRKTSKQYGSSTEKWKMTLITSKKELFVY